MILIRDATLRLFNNLHRLPLLPRPLKLHAQPTHTNADEEDKNEKCPEAKLKPAASSFFCHDGLLLLLRLGLKGYITVGQRLTQPLNTLGSDSRVVEPQLCKVSHPFEMLKPSISDLRVVEIQTGEISQPL